MSSLVLAEISRSDLANLQSLNGKITNFQHLASYSWLNKRLPTISVPGHLPLWSPLELPHKLRPDSGEQFVDQNAARHPKSPLEPLFRALYVENPDFKVSDIDIVTDRNNIRKLLRFVKGSSNGPRDGPFQMRVEIAGDKTALFTRVEAQTMETHHGKRYGHNFVRAFTKRQCGATGHHRIASYEFGGMKCVVRYSTDAYVGQGDPTQQTEDLSDMLGEVFISSCSESEDLAVEPSGRTVDPSSILEIKTRAKHRELEMSETMPQLWTAQTTKLAIAYHSNGIFKTSELRDVTGDILEWEMNNQRDLCLLAGLLREIVSKVKRYDGKAALVKYDGDKKLRILSDKRVQALPNDLYKKWEEKKPRSDSVTVPGAEETKAAQAQSKDGKDGASNTPQSLQAKASSIIPRDIPFADVIDEARQKGFRQFFRLMPTRLSDYHILCKSLRSLSLDIPAGRNLQSVITDLRLGKSEWDPDYGRQMTGQKGPARDSAFRLLYLLLLDGTDSDPTRANSAFNAVLFVVSHRRIFQYRTRKMVREAFEDKFNVSYKQRKNLDKYPIGSPDGEEVTTDEELFDEYSLDSDYSF